MADYVGNLDPSDYLYSGPVYYTDPLGEARDERVLRLRLNSENFNFNLAQSDGTDFRLAESAGGYNVLNMWIAEWDKSAERAIIFFKGLGIGANSSVEYTAFWGNDEAENISDGDSIGALFYDDFDTSPLDSSKWEGDISNGVTSYGYYVNRGSSSFTTKTNPLRQIRSWIVECGIYTNWSHTGGWDINDWAIGFQFPGTENGFYISFMHDSRRETNIVDGSAFNSNGTHYGLEGYSYQEAYLVYNEPEDRARFKLIERNTFSDTSTSWRRKVEGDTRGEEIRIHGAQTSSYQDGAYPTYVRWIIAKEFDTYDHTTGLDGSELYQDYAHVPHQNIDFREYGDDLTDPDYFHASSFGGVPRNLSVDLSDTLEDSWISDEAAADEEYVEVGIGFYGAWDLTSRRYYHYDDGHVDFYNASKLSDNGRDTWDRDWFESTMSSGYVSIKYEGRYRSVGHISIKAMDTGRPKNFTFYADTVKPTTTYSLGKELLSGTFIDTEDWQHVIIPNSSEQKYYTLEIHDTYDDENIKIEEWQMHSATQDHTKKHVQQLRLHPCTFNESYVEAFPKEIQLEGSNDMVNWTVLIPWKETYSPYVVHKAQYGYWQHYSFDNISGFFNFRLLCRGNWGRTDGRMAIGQWELRELSSEDYTHRILSGISNNISQIWTLDGRTFDDDESYLAIDDLSVVADNKLSRTEELPEDYTDINVV